MLKRHFLPRIFCCALAIAITANSSFSASANDSRFLWKENKNNYIKQLLVDGKHTAKNEHPVRLQRSMLKPALQALTIQHTSKQGKNKEPQRLFTANQVTLLSQYLAEGLSEATPSHDVVFALERKVRRSFGLSSKRLFVSGRVFYSQGKLNLLIGEHNKPIDEGFAAAYDPTNMGIIQYEFNHGERQALSPGIHLNANADRLGSPTQIHYAKARTDWVMIDLPDVGGSFKTAKNVQQSTQRPSSGIGQRSPSSAVPAAKVDKARQPVLSPVAPSAARPVESRTKLPARPSLPSSANSIEERLIQLKSLYAKGLITDGEYETKKQSILDEL